MYLDDVRGGPTLHPDVRILVMPGHLLERMPCRVDKRAQVISRGARTNPVWRFGNMRR